jgi:two-component system response regulator RegA
MRYTFAQDDRLGARPEWFLIIDATPAGTMLLDELRKLGVRADLTSTGAAGLTLLEARQVRPSAIVLETRLPDGFGLNLLPKIHDVSPSSKVVFVTAYGSIASAVRAVQLGAHDYLCKPVCVKTLRQSLARGRKPSSPTEEPLLTQHPSLDRSIWEHINYVLADAGTISGAARRMRLDRRSLRRMLQKCPPLR